MNNLIELPLKKYTDLSIDLETMGNNKRAVVASIGAIAFNIETGEVSENVFYRLVDMDSCVKIGLEYSSHTIMWWLRQNDNARAEIYQQGRQPISSVLSDLIEYIVNNCIGDVRVWGRGASFDNAILAEAFTLCGYDLPWSFWNDSCQRTMSLIDMRFLKCKNGVRKEDHHLALSDAVYQAKQLCDWWYKLQIAFDTGK